MNESKPITGINPIRHKRELKPIPASEFIKPLPVQVEESLLGVIGKSLLWFLFRHGGTALRAMATFAKVSKPVALVLNLTAKSLDWLYKRYGEE